MRTGQLNALYIQGIEPDEDGSTVGIPCTRCGCRDLRVVTTRRKESVIERYRQCRHCGWSIRTREIIG
jgi:hypothetical protein